MGLDGLAITDHDTIAGIPGILELARHAPLKLICGIEVSARDPKSMRKVHLLGYRAQDIPAQGATVELTKLTLDGRDAIARWQIEALQEDGYTLTEELVRAAGQGSTAMYKQHLMACITPAKPGSDEYRDIYRALLGPKGRYYHEVFYPDAQDAIDALVQDGALPVLAHPGQSRNLHMVPELVSRGLIGIELNHPDHSSDAKRAIHELAGRYDLIKTGGSDHHGMVGRGRDVGSNLVPREGLARVLDVLSIDS